MRMWAVRGMMLSVLLMACQAGLAPAQDGGEAQQENLENLLTHAVDLFEQGRWYEAKAALDKIYAENPTSEQCWKLREAFGDKILRDMASWMRHGRTLGPGALEVLKRAQYFEQQQLYDPTHIDQVVGEVVRVDELPQVGLYKIHQLGQYAVPSLIKYLRSGRDDVARTNASYILVHLGTQVVVPLAEALNAEDELLLQHICFILSKIQPRDTRALPALKRLYERSEGLPAVKAAAARALEAISGQKVDSLEPAWKLYYREANRIYLGGATVHEEMDDLRGAFWAWNPKVEGEGKGALQFVQVPIYELDDLMTQELLYDALDLEGDMDEIEVLLSCSLLQQGEENADMSVILDRQAIENPELVAEQTEFKVWRRRLRNNHEIAWTIGPRRLVSVLDKALLDAKPRVAVAALRGVEAVAQPDGWEMVKAWAHPLPEAEKDEKAAPAEGDETGKAPEPEKKMADGSMTASPMPADAAEAPTEKEEEAAAPAVRHAILVALDNPDRRVKVAAANCLVRIGLPSDHPDYMRLSGILSEGAQESSKQVVLVISNNAKTRERFAKILEEKNVMAITAPSGREGVALAQQYPPKDGIILDSETAEFARLRERMALHDVVAGSPLPMVIITTRRRADDVVKQFNEKMWSIHVWTNMTAESPNLYDRLHALQRYREEKQVLAVLTQEDQKERRRIQQELQLQAERRGRPQRQSELLNLMNDDQKKLLSDIFPVRSTFVNVFLDEDLNGYHAMRTVQEIRRWPATAKVPIALLVSPERKKHVNSEFERFVDDPADMRLMDYAIDHRDLLNEVQNMTELNPISKKNYLRKMYDRIAERSAIGLARLDPHIGIALSDEEVDGLRSVLGDPLRPRSLRARVAQAMSHLKAKRGLETLVKVFRDEDPKYVDLRRWCMHAIGTNDLENKYRDIKTSALTEMVPEVQREAARALALADGDAGYHKSVLKDVRPNRPLELIEKGVGSGLPDEAAAPDQPADQPAAQPDEQPDEQPEDAPEDEPEDKPVESIW